MRRRWPLSGRRRRAPRQMRQQQHRRWRRNLRSSGQQHGESWPQRDVRLRKRPPQRQLPGEAGSTLHIAAAVTREMPLRTANELAAMQPLQWKPPQWRPMPSRGSEGFGMHHGFRDLSRQRELTAAWCAAEEAAVTVSNATDRLRVARSQVAAAV